jgi:hypothetical protein
MRAPAADQTPRRGFSLFLHHLEDTAVKDRTESGQQTNSVPVAVGKTAAEGIAAGQQANRQFNDQLNAQFEKRRPSTKDSTTTGAKGGL